MKTIFALVLAAIVSPLAASAQGLINETSFFNRVYRHPTDGSQLKLLSNPSLKDKGFRQCVLWNGSKLFKGDTKGADCVWEYGTKEKALIVWVAGNRDWWDVLDSGARISESGYILYLQPKGPKI